MKPRKEISGRIFSREEFEQMADSLPDNQKHPFEKTYYQQIEAILGSPVTKPKVPTSDSVIETSIIAIRFSRRGLFRRLRLVIS